MSTNQKSIDWYNENSNEYTQHVRDKDDSRYHSLYEKPAMYSFVPNIKMKNVLSLGCGSGEDSSYLKSLGAKASVGVDISKGMIEIAKLSYPECDFKIMNMEKLDLPDNSFDFVYSSLAIHYIEDWSDVFSEVYRILKTNSYFLFSCNHPVQSSMVPIQTSEGGKRLDLSMLTGKEVKAEDINGDYVNRHPAFYDANVTTWHKSFEEIFQEFSSAGFILDTLEHPKPLEKMREIAPHSYEKLVKIPTFSIFRLKKNN